MADVKYIYFYINNKHNRPLYIGQTVDVVGRFRQHVFENQLFRLTDKIYYMDLPDDYTKDQVDLVESYFIALFHPVISECRRKYFVANLDVLTTSARVYEVLKDSGDFDRFLDEYCDVIQVQDGGCVNGRKKNVRKNNH